MAHFAQIDNDVVQQVIVIHNNDAPTETAGKWFISDILGYSGEWIQCSYNNNIRKQYPGVGYTYDRVRDEFVAPQPYPSWTLDANNDWQPPTPYPGDDDHPYRWDEDQLDWVAIA